MENLTNRIRLSLPICFLLVLSALFVNRPVSAQFSPRWAETDSLPVYCVGKATTLLNGNVLLFLEDRKTMIYNCISEKWNIADSLNYYRYDPELITLDNGYVLLVGTYRTRIEKTTELYNPSTNEWQITGNTNIVHHDGYNLIKLKNGKILLSGGYTRVGSSTVLTNICEIYDPQTFLWTVVDTMRISRAGHKAVLLNDGRVLVAGGTSAASSEIYDPATNKWKLTSNYYYTGSSQSLLKLRTGKVVRFTGGSVELFDPDLNNWVRSDSNNRIGIWYFSLYYLDNNNILAFSRIKERMVAEEINEADFSVLSTDTLHEIQNSTYGFRGNKNETFIYKLGTGKYITPGGWMLTWFGSDPLYWYSEKCQVYTPSFITKTESNYSKKNLVVMEQNYPNPFSSNTTISYTLPKEEFVIIQVYNTLGELVTILTQGYKPAGEHKETINLPGTAKGVYLCRLQAGKEIKTIKMLVAGKAD